jgi:hypothetical protein
MAQYLLVLYRDYSVPVPPERSRQVWARVSKLEDAGALVFKGGLQGGAESAAEQRPIEVRPLFGGDLDDAIRLG